MFFYFFLILINIVYAINLNCAGQCYFNINGNTCVSSVSSTVINCNPKFSGGSCVYPCKEISKSGICELQKIIPVKNLLKCPSTCHNLAEGGGCITNSNSENGCFYCSEYDNNCAYRDYKDVCPSFCFYDNEKQKCMLNINTNKNINNVCYGTIKICPDGYIAKNLSIYNVPDCTFSNNDKLCNNSGNIQYPAPINPYYTNNYSYCEYFKDLDCKTMAFAKIVSCPDGCYIDTLTNNCKHKSSNIMCGGYNLKCPSNYPVGCEVYTKYPTPPICDENYMLLNITVGGKILIKCGPKWYYEK